MVNRIVCAGLLLLLILSVSPAAGQSRAQNKAEEYYSIEGDVNVWTTAPVLRQKTGMSPELLKMRFGRHRDFDRIVYELDGEPIGYYITYSEPPFQGEASEDVTKVRGKAFVEIALYPVVASDENLNASERLLAQQNKIRMPLIREVQTIEWFEAELRHVVGLRRRTPFRVQVFSNPTRLVVDFRH
ncbi:MAG TPA: hypothetical protein VJT09_01635 [Pyrinomonadaceae bacterium]|nr:hypothetical protein [Pyrinomonadaceae bacterium]